MKILITLGVLQTIGIVVLILHALNTDDHVQREQQTQIPGTAISPTDMRAQHGSAALLADEERLRKIVREELTPLLAQRTRQAKPAAAERARHESEDRRRQELIAQQIETYQAVGSITDQQMQELQAGIAELDEASRKQMMSTLIRALNSGESKAGCEVSCWRRTEGVIHAHKTTDGSHRARSEFVGGNGGIGAALAGGGHALR